MSDPARDRHLLVLAKAPVPGRVKTRLCPPLTAELAADVAEAALRDTLAAVTRSRARRRTLVLDGAPGRWLDDGFDVVAQADGGLAERLEAAWAWAAVGEATVQLGMDTPQVTPDLLDESLDRLGDARTDAVLGPAEDGGWWAIGFDRPRPGAFRGIPMSTAETGAHQLARLHAMGLRVHILPTLRDLDTAADATAIATGIPESRTARAVRDAFATAGVS